MCRVINMSRADTAPAEDRWQRTCRRWILAAMVVVSLFGKTALAMAEVTVIDIDHARVEDILPAAEMLLSPNGKLSFDRRTHALVVMDNPEAIAGIRTLLKKLDVPVPQITVRVRFVENRTNDKRSVTGRGRVSAPGGSIGTPGTNVDGLRLTLENRNRASRHTTEQIIRTTSGSPALITVGREIPYSQTWNLLCRKYAACGTNTAFHRVETGFEITPSARGDRVHLRITPRIGSMDPAVPGATRFAGAATEIFTTPGQWIDLGAMVAAENEVFSEILGRGGGAGTEQTNIMIRVEMIR